jgi:hypothetical protein
VVRVHQQTLWEEEEEARDEGMAWAATASAPWVVVATDWVVARPEGTVIHPDHVTTAVGVPTSQGACGALFRALHLRGVIRPGGRAISRREGRHHSGVQLWVRV